MKSLRITAYLLASILLVTITSCGADSENLSRQTTETEHDSAGTTELVPTAPESDGLPDKDMDGWELSILRDSEETLSWANTTILVNEANGDILNDSFYERNQALSERFNFILKVEDVDNVWKHIAKLVLAGDETYDIYSMNEAAREGPLTMFMQYTQDWNKIPVIQLDEPWWNPDATSVYNINGKQTALSGNMTLSAVSRAVCMVFNKDLWKKYGDSNINFYELVDDNIWTVDKYMTIAKSIGADLDGNTKMDANDLYGLNMGRGFKGYIASFLAGSAMNFTGMNSDSENIFTLNTDERALNLIIKLVDALNESGYYYNESTGVDSFAPSNFFKSGHALFTQEVPNGIYKLRDMDNDIGILPMPKHDEKQEKYYSAAWGGAVWTLSKTFNLADSEKLGTVLEAMCFATYKDIIPVYKEVALKTKTARDNESADMLDIIFDSIYFDYGTNIMYDSVCAPTFLTAIWDKKSSDIIISSIEEALPKITKFIDDINVIANEMK